MDEEQRSTTGATGGKDEEDAGLVNGNADGRQTSVADVLDEDERKELWEVLANVGDDMTASRGLVGISLAI